jgi:hypothetical protein
MQMVASVSRAAKTATINSSTGASAAPAHPVTPAKISVADMAIVTMTLLMSFIIFPDAGPAKPQPPFNIAAIEKGSHRKGCESG